MTPLFTIEEPPRAAPRGFALFALGFQPVKQQRIINIVACVTNAFAVAFECRKLVLVNHFAVEHQSSNQCCFSVIY